MSKISGNFKLVCHIEYAEVINIHTIKPLDKKIILESVSRTKCIVSAEEHNYLGGLGESISRVLSKNMPLPQEFVATQPTPTLRM